MSKLLKRVNWKLLGLSTALSSMIALLVAWQIGMHNMNPWESNPDDWYVERIDTVGWEKTKWNYVYQIESWRRAPNSLNAVIDTVTNLDSATIYHYPLVRAIDSNKTWQPITQPIYKQKIHGWTEEELEAIKRLIVEASGS